MIVLIFSLCGYEFELSTRTETEVLNEILLFMSSAITINECSVLSGYGTVFHENSYGPELSLIPVDKLSIHSSTNFTESLSDASHCMVIISETRKILQEI